MPISITGERLKERRTALQMSADDVASELGVSRSTIFRYENGHIEKVPANIIERLATILHTTPAYLMGWTDDPHDWERIGNDEGVYPPKDYEGSYTDYVKYKVMQESDDIVNSYYSTYEEAVRYLRNLGCSVLDDSETNEITIITPRKENIRVNTDDLVFNFMVFGASRPGVKKLATPRRHNDPANTKAISTIAAHLEGKKLTPQKLKLLEQYIKTLFDEE